MSYRVKILEGARGFVIIFLMRCGRLETVRFYLPLSLLWYICFTLTGSETDSVTAENLQESVRRYPEVFSWE
jgi:hypothetical protein